MFLVLVCQKFDAVENIFNLNVKVESESQRGFTAVLLKLDLNLRQNSFSQQLKMGKITCFIKTFKIWKYWRIHVSLKDWQISVLWLDTIFLILLLIGGCNQSCMHCWSDLSHLWTVFILREPRQGEKHTNEWQIHRR